MEAMEISYYKSMPIEKAVKMVMQRAVWYGLGSLLMCMRCRRWWAQRAGDDHKCANIDCPDNQQIFYVFASGHTEKAFSDVLSRRERAKCMPWERIKKARVS